MWLRMPFASCAAASNRRFAAISDTSPKPVSGQLRVGRLQIHNLVGFPEVFFILTTNSQFMLTGYLHLPTREMAEEFLGYPTTGDQRKVRPTIRATEISFPCDDQAWSAKFWEEAWQRTPCMELARPRPPAAPVVNVTRARISEVSDKLLRHWKETHSTTAIDAKHDAVFGMAFYSLRLLEEMMGIGIDSSVLGRLGLRTILEVHISLRYLLVKNEEELWKKWRAYGSGQAKLNALKFDGVVDPPRYIDVTSIEGIASEDIWEEMLPINLASWSGLDLRRLSEQSTLKDTYDQYYSWTSGYVHGTWGPIRESCFETCTNPLHRKSAISA
jgi:hypothetical protein